MSKIETMLQFAVNIANDDSHGYDQINRWGTDYDCSSLVITAAKTAGYDVGGATYTGNMTSNFLKAGFTKITDIASRKRGDVLLNVKHHTALYLGDNKIVQASINEKGGISGGQKGDQTGREILVRDYYTPSYGWDCILRPPLEDTATASQPVTASQTASSGSALIRKGSKGEAVKQLQNRLIALGYSCGSYGADGDFGTATEKAVKQFQQDHGLEVDGIVGS